MKCPACHGERIDPDTQALCLVCHGTGEDQKRPKVITLCGSSRFVQQMAVCAWFLERDEHAIAMSLHLLPAWYPDCPEKHLAEFEGVAEAMDQLHLRKIDLSDEIFVVNCQDYIGSSTTNEVRYAQSLGKPIRWYTSDPIGRSVEAMIQTLLAEAREGKPPMWTLADLREATIRRQAEWCDNGELPDISYRAMELAGETGEACNIVKKMERERHGWRGSRATAKDLAEELADVVICADLTALAAGIDLMAAVRDKFNATTEKVGLTTKLAA